MRGRERALHSSQYPLPSPGSPSSLRFDVRHPLPQAGEGRKESQPSPFSRRVCVRVMSSRNAAKNEGGAGRRGPGMQAQPAGTRGPDCLAATGRSDASRSSAARLGSPQVRHFSSVPRAVLEALLWAAPGGLSFQAPCSREGRLSTAVGASTGLGGWHRRYDLPPRAPGGARLARRDRSASAVATRVCVLHPFATTAPDPHRRTPPEGAPRGSRRAHYPARFSRGDKLFFGELSSLLRMARRPPRPAQWRRVRVPGA